MADRRNEDHLPVEIVVITSYRDVDALERALENAGVDLERPDSGVYVAGTPLEGSAVYRLAGIVDPNGSATEAASSTLNNLARASDLGEWPISDKGLTEGPVRQMWWYISNGHYEIVSRAASLARGSSEEAQQATTLVNRVREHLQARYAALPELAGIEAYSDGEELLQDLDAAGISELRDVERDLRSALRDAARADGMREELQARDAYKRILGLFASRSMRDRNNAEDAMRQLANALPDTVYGQKAAGRDRALDGFSRR